MALMEKKVEFLIGSPVVFFFYMHHHSDQGKQQMFVIPRITFFFVEYALDETVDPRFPSSHFSQTSSRVETEEYFIQWGKQKNVLKMKLAYHKVTSVFYVKLN